MMLSPAMKAAEARRPNILFILADDLGWGDPSCYDWYRENLPGGPPDWRSFGCSPFDAIAAAVN
jgi:hypothetical protein